MSATTWRKRAACRGLDAEIFFPGTDDEADAAEAKAICALCPVRQACLEHALASREREGVGVLSEPRNVVSQARIGHDGQDTAVQDGVEAGIGSLVDICPG